MTLTDKLNRPLRDLRISVTDRCNFRCIYCMPKEVFGSDYQFLERDQILSFEEITRLARIFVAQGVGKIRLTGGEPLVRKDLPQLIGMLSSISPDLDLTLTTNGSLLVRQAQALKDAGLKRVSVSLATLWDTPSLCGLVDRIPRCLPSLLNFGTLRPRSCSSALTDFQFIFHPNPLEVERAFTRETRGTTRISGRVTIPFHVFRVG